MNTRNYVFAGGLVLAVGAAGVTMQTVMESPLLPSPVPAAAVHLSAEMPVPEMDGGAALPQVSAGPDGALRQPPPLPQPSRDASRTAEGDCPLDVTALPAGEAMILLTISAPCAGGARVGVSHAGIGFDADLDDRGRYSGVVPAMTPRARFDVALPGGRSAGATAEVEGLDRITRVAVSWRGAGAMALYGAGQGEAMRLGSKDAFAVIYSEPASAGGDGLGLEAEITEQTCGTDMGGVLHRRDAAGSVVARDFMIAMPDCGAVGDIVLLNNFVPETKVALNQ